MRVLLVVSLLCIFLGGVSGFNVYQYPREYLDDDMYFDGYDWLDRAVLVVDSGLVNPGWTKEGIAKKSGDGLIEDKWNSITFFMVEVDNDYAEQFGPPVYRIDGAPLLPGESDAEGRSDDIMTIVTTGDAAFGNFDEKDSEDEVFFLKMHYYCAAPGLRTISTTVTVVDVLDKVTNVTFYWQKQCGSGVRQGFDIVVSEIPSWDDEQLATVVSNGVTRPHWNFESPEHKLPLSRWETEFLISLREGYGSQAYSKPEVTCSNEEILLVRPLGEAANSNTIKSTDIYQRLKVLHTCLGTTGEAVVSVTFGLGSFDDISFSWIKSCEGSDGFLISSEPTGEANVVQNSQTQAQWDLKDPKIIVPKDEKSTTFYMKSSGSAISYRKPIITSSPSHVVRVSLAGDYVYGGLLVSEPEELRVEYRCLQKGKATVHIAIPFSEHEHPIQFAWIKECPKFIRRPRDNHRGYMTANRAMLLFCFITLLMTVLGCYTFINWKRRKVAEKTARLRAAQDGLI